MRILGIDPGLARTGYGIIDQKDEETLLLDYGTLTTEPEISIGERLSGLKLQFTTLLETFHPEHLAIERLFFSQNVQTATVVGMACGVLFASAHEGGLPIFEYTPLQVKLALTGYGRATKQQIQAMVKSLLKLASLPKPDDAADAVAIAICHAHSFPTLNLIAKAEHVHS